MYFQDQLNWFFLAFVDIVCKVKSDVLDLKFFNRVTDIPDQMKHTGVSVEIFQRNHIYWHEEAKEYKFTFPTICDIFDVAICDKVTKCSAHF